MAVVQVPPETYELMSHAGKQGAEAEKKWDESWAQYKSKYPEVHPICTTPRLSLLGAIAIGSQPPMLPAVGHSVCRPLLSLIGMN